jgi:hypothetical protein
MTKSTAAQALNDIKVLVDTVYNLKKLADEAEKKFKDAKNKLAEIMEEAEVDKMQGDECNVSLKLKSSVSVPKDHKDKQDLFDYIKNEYDESVLFDMITINAMTFSSFYNAEVEKKVNEGNFDWTLPMLKPHDRMSLGIRKRSKKA